MMAAALMCGAGFLVGCADDVDLVKDGVWDGDETRTVEQMLSSKLDDLQWKSFESKDNRRIVEVTGVWKDKTFREAAKGGGLDVAIAMMGGLFDVLPLDGDKLTLQFAIHADGEHFKFVYGEITDANGKVKEMGTTGIKAVTGQAFDPPEKFLNLFNQ